MRLDASAVIALGGYVHPLFTSQRPPVPGQGLLLVMGGLAEQSGIYGAETRALLGFERVDFHAMAFDGDDVEIEIDPLPAESARVTRWRWRCVRSDGTLLAEAIARFLVTSHS